MATAQQVSFCSSFDLIDGAKFEDHPKKISGEIIESLTVLKKPPDDVIMLLFCIIQQL